MFRFLAVLLISGLCATTAVAHEDWGYRPHHRHHRDSFVYGYNPLYGGYAPPPRVGYYPAPPQYYTLPPVRGFSYVQPIPTPRCNRRFQSRW